MGGGFALLTAGRGFDASASNYGHAARSSSTRRSRAPARSSRSYGAKDRELRGAAAQARGGAVSAPASSTTSRSTPDAGHSFLNRHNLGPGGAAAARGRRRLRRRVGRGRLGADPAVLRDPPRRAREHPGPQRDVARHGRGGARRDQHAELERPRRASASSPCRTASAPLVSPSVRKNTTAPSACWRSRPARPRTPKVSRRFAAVLPTAVSASASAFAPAAPSGAAQHEEQQRVGERAQRRRRP